MARYYFRKILKSERGAAAVEFAIVALLLFTLIFGIIEFGWIFFGWITLTGAVREGARLAIVNEDRNTVIDAVTRHALIMDNLIVDMTRSGVHGTETTVTADGDLPLILGFFFTGRSISLSVEATMRQE